MKIIKEEIIILQLNPRELDVISNALDKSYQNKENELRLMALDLYCQIRKFQGYD